MDYQELFRKKELYSQCRGSIPDYTLFTFEQAFEIEYTHNSTAIEGNTLSLIETKVLLEDGISIGGKALREIYEAVNHRKAFRYVKECIGQGMPLDEKIIKDIHALLMENIQVGGVYRDVQVYISGARHMPPPPVPDVPAGKGLLRGSVLEGEGTEPGGAGGMDPCGVCEDTPVHGREREDVKAHHELPAYGGGVPGHIHRQGGQAGIFQDAGCLCGGGEPAAVCGPGGRACGQAAGTLH